MPQPADIPKCWERSKRWATFLFWMKIIKGRAPIRLSLWNSSMLAVEEVIQQPEVSSNYAVVMEKNTQSVWLTSEARMGIFTAWIRRSRDLKLYMAKIGSWSLTSSLAVMEARSLFLSWIINAGTSERQANPGTPKLSVLFSPKFGPTTETFGKPVLLSR